MNPKQKKIAIIAIIFFIIIVTILSTFAWYTWRSANNTELTGTVGNVNCGSVTEENLAPVLYYDDGVELKCSVKNTQTSAKTTDVKMVVSSISANLKNSNVKYKVLSSTDNSTFTELNSGDFSSATDGGTIYFNQNKAISANQTIYYKIYIYIDGSVANNVNMMNNSLVGEVYATVED